MNRIRCVTYGKEAYSPRKFKPVKNRPDHFKPIGGLWSSPVSSEHSWKEWCLGESFYPESLEVGFQFTFVGRLLVIDSVSDLNQLPVVDKGYACHIVTLDCEQILANGFDGIHLTERGERDTRFSMPRSLYGWDCETVYVMNKKAITEVTNERHHQGTASQHPQVPAQDRPQPRPETDG